MASAVEVAPAPNATATDPSSLDEAGVVGGGGIPGGSACPEKGTNDDLSGGGGVGGGDVSHGDEMTQVRSAGSVVAGSTTSNKGDCADGCSEKGAEYDRRGDSCRVDDVSSVVDSRTIIAEEVERTMKKPERTGAFGNSSRSTGGRAATLAYDNNTHNEDDAGHVVGNDNDDEDDVASGVSRSPPPSCTSSQRPQPQSFPSPRRKKKSRGAKTKKGNKPPSSRSPGRSRRGRSGGLGRDWAKEAKRRRKIYNKVAKDDTFNQGAAGVVTVGGDDGIGGGSLLCGNGGEGLPEDERWGKAGMESVVDLGQWGAGVHNLEIQQR